MVQKTLIWKNTTKTILGTVILSMLFACGTQESQEIAEDETSDLKQKSLYAQNTENVAWQNEKSIHGNALGTTFVVKSSDDSLLTNPEQIDALIEDFNQELSTYHSSSLISHFNTADTTIDLDSTKYFQQCFELSKTIYEQTGGAFDPTVYPLVSLWGFFKDIDVVPTEDEIDSVLQFVGLDKSTFQYEEGLLNKKDSRFKLVFNAIAKGQFVDVLATHLEDKGQSQYFIEVGGEIRVKGKNDQGKNWVIGIDEPVESNTGVKGEQQRELENYISISDKAVATSGNYRKFYELNGRKYSHTISSKTGRPVKHNILSATVIAEDAATADAFATAFMVMGVEESLQLIKDNPEFGIESYLLFENKQGRIERAYSRGMNQYLLD